MQVHPFGNYITVVKSSLKTYKPAFHSGHLSCNTSYVLWDTLDINNFYFLFLLFSDFIGILFSFSFLLDDEEARDIAVT